MRNTLAALAAAMLLAAGSAYAQAPAMVPLQGTLTDAEGVALDGVHTVTFSLYDGVDAADAVWTELQDIELTNGFFAAELGSETVLDLELFALHGDLFLGVAIGADDELPRIPLGSTPYAAYAEFAGSALDLNGMAAEDFAPSFTVGDGLEMSDDGVLSANMSIDPSDVLSAIGDCAVGEVIAGIAADGTVSCVSMSSYEAGAGMALTDGVFAVDRAYTDGIYVNTDEPSSVTSEMVVDGTLGLADVDAFAIQARVSGQCATGAIRQISPDGSVTCADDNSAERCPDHHVLDGSGACVPMISPLQGADNRNLEIEADTFVMSSTAVTLPSAGTCVVTTTGFAYQLDDGDDVEGFYFRTAMATTSRPERDFRTGGYPFHFDGSSRSTAVSATHVWSVEADTPTTFGCAALAAPASWQGDRVSCRVSWTCALNAPVD